MQKEQAARQARQRDKDTAKRAKDTAKQTKDTAKAAKATHAQQDREAAAPVEPQFTNKPPPSAIKIPGRKPVTGPAQPQGQQDMSALSNNDVVHELLARGVGLDETFGLSTEALRGMLRAVRSFTPRDYLRVLSHIGAPDHDIDTALQARRKMANHPSWEPHLAALWEERRVAWVAVEAAWHAAQAPVLALRQWQGCAAVERAFGAWRAAASSRTAVASAAVEWRSCARR
eukprot:COSAG01_NODE_20904_length_928_cov_4.299156_1_plen_230_part_00